ncbi:MAG TPA: helix-turn-helix transcriptional regulator [Chitinophagaceae bacterium]
MLKLEYNHTDYEELLKFYAKSFKSKIKDGVLTIDPAIGSGYMKLVRLPNGLQCLVSEYSFKEDILFQRKKSDEDYYTLRFDEVVNKSGAPEVTSKSAVFLASTRFEWLFLYTTGTIVRNVNIHFSKEWLEHFLGVESVGEVIRKYLSLKMSAFNYEPMDAEYKRVLGELMNAGQSKGFEQLIIQNRTMLLIERFFTRIYKKMNDQHFDMKVSNDDILRLQKVEQELLKDFSTPPPGISRLAKMAAMSPSKLKNTFKEIYGLPIYQYFQKHRMNKAKAMLLSNRYNVKEVGMEVGYSNLSNFAKAFKKSFDQLPSDIITGR